MESFTSLTVPEEDRPVLTDFLQRQGHQAGSLPQGFPGIPTSGFFAHNQMNAFAPPWSPNPISLRQDCSHRPNGPINYSLNQRPETTRVTGMSVANDNSRDSIIFSSPASNIPNKNNINNMQQQLHNCQNPKPVPAVNVRTFKCGGCYMTFDTICKLHKHLRCHGGSGSYVYDNITQTAHPRKGNKNSETQTGIAHEPQHNSRHPQSESTDVQQESKVKEHVDFVEELLEGTIDNTETTETKTEAKTEAEEIDTMIKEEEEEKVEEDDGKRRSRRKITPVILAKVELQKEFQRFIQKRKKKKKIQRKIKRTVKVQCPQCSLEFPTKCLPKAEKEKEKVRRVKCDICHKQVNSLNALLHIKRCLGMPAFSCPKTGCGKTFTRRYTLMQHQKLHAEGTPFSCEACGIGFPNSERFMKHMRMHTEKRPWKCDQCPSFFKTKQHLQRHEKTHTKETPFMCHCGKRFSQEGNLKTHMRVHSDEKPYVCHLCGKGFKYNVSKKKHMKVHADDSLGCVEHHDEIEIAPRNMLTDVVMSHQHQQHLPGPPIM